MRRLTLSPFGQQPVSAGLLKLQEHVDAQKNGSEHNKWALFRALRKAKQGFGLKDRELTVLNALLTFYPNDRLSTEGPIVVFPSNASLVERANGMPESTLRRHLAKLVNAGLIRRHDSPNGKRYARRDRAGQVVRAFGFDLSPLLARQAEIIAAAEQVALEEDARRLLREDCSLSIRDAIKFIHYGSSETPEAKNWDALDDQLRLIQRALRRKLTLADLQEVLEEIRQIITLSEPVCEPESAEEMSGKDVQNERHLQNSNTDDLKKEDTPSVDKQSLIDVVETCSEARSLSLEPSKDWRSFTANTATLAPMMGISPTLWQHAIRVMGPERSATTIAAMLERLSHIRNPSGYFRRLVQKAEKGQFDPMRMIKAIQRANVVRAAG